MQLRIIVNDIDFHQLSNNIKKNRNSITQDRNQPMQTTQVSDSLTLLNQLKHKRFSSQMTLNQKNPQTQSCFINTSMRSSNNGFACPSHPTETVTNFWVWQDSQGNNAAKPLCPRCLQSHFKSQSLAYTQSHSVSPQNNTKPSIQTSQHQLSLITNCLNTSLQSCHQLESNIKTYYQLHTRSLTQIKSQLVEYKQQILQLIEIMFAKLEKQAEASFSQHILKTYNEKKRELEEVVNDLKAKAERGLGFVKESKDVTGLVMLWPLVQKRTKQMAQLEKQLNLKGMRAMEQATAKSKLPQIISALEKSISFNIKPITHYQLTSTLNHSSQQSPQSTINPSPESNLHKLQSLMNNPQKPTSKLHTISSSTPFTKQPSTISSTPKDELILDKLNDTTNKLKSSLNGMKIVKK